MKTKEALFSEIEKMLHSQGFEIDQVDDGRPWGGFFVIDESQAQRFTEQYFDGLVTAEMKNAGKLSPKILLVAPSKRLSWQYHHRRAEIWKVLEGSVAVMKSDTDEETEPATYGEGAIVKLHQGERHRLIGLGDWAILAEIWQHTDTENPSDEEDIVRLQDDFGRG